MSREARRATILEAAMLLRNIREDLRGGVGAIVSTGQYRVQAHYMVARALLALGYCVYAPRDARVGSYIEVGPLVPREAGLPIRRM